MQFQYSTIIARLARGFDPTSPRAVEGFSSLHPIRRIKGWFDRRRETRIRVRIPAILTVNGADQSVIISDTSSSGIGLTQTSGLRVGDHVQVSVRNGRTRSGTIVWTKQDWAGVALDE